MRKCENAGLGFDNNNNEKSKLNAFVKHPIGEENMSELKSAHYTNFGVSMQPCVADREGYIGYREDFYCLPESQWTDGECWIAEQEERIDAWRRTTQ